MKKLIFVCIAMAALFSSCNNNNKSGTGTKDKEEKTVTDKSSGSMTGTYKTTEVGQPMQFTLKEDSTGFEIYHGENRPFTWAMKEGKIYFKYNGEPHEWELPIDVEKGEIHYASLVYKKE